MFDWQPPETAPKGQKVLTWSVDQGYVVAVLSGDQWIEPISIVSIATPTCWTHFPTLFFGCYVEGNRDSGIHVGGNYETS